MELNFSRNGLCVWSFGSVYCCNAVVERIRHRQLLIGSTLVSLLQKCVNLLVLLTVQMDQIFWICGWTDRWMVNNDRHFCSAKAVNSEKEIWEKK